MILHDQEAVGDTESPGYSGGNDSDLLCMDMYSKDTAWVHE